MLWESDLNREFSTVEETLNLDEEACEDLAVKAFQLKLLRGRLDQGNERISTTYAIKRDFTEGDWIDLKNKVSFADISPLISDIQNFKKFSKKSFKKNLR